MGFFDQYKGQVGAGLREGGAAPRATVRMDDPLQVIMGVGQELNDRLAKLEGAKAGGCSCGTKGAGRPAYKRVWGETGLIRFVKIAAVLGPNGGTIPLSGLNVNGTGVNKQTGRARDVRLAILQDSANVFEALTEVQADDRAPDQNMPSGGVPAVVMRFLRDADIQYGYRYMGPKIERALNFRFDATGPGSVWVGLFSTDPAFLARANAGTNCVIPAEADDDDGDE
jgi:hypothetical protein